MNPEPTPIPVPDLAQLQLPTSRIEAPPALAGWCSPGAQWDEIKAAASQILHDHRATSTHHHAVGRDHRPWYRQRPDLFAAALSAAKKVLASP